MTHNGSCLTCCLPSSPASLRASAGVMYSGSAEFPADMGTVCGADCVRGIIINNTDSKVTLSCLKESISFSSLALLMTV